MSTKNMTNSKLLARAATTKVRRIGRADKTQARARERNASKAPREATALKRRAIERWEDEGGAAMTLPTAPNL
jgi:hypothetical protein